MQDSALLTQYALTGSEAAFSQLLARHLPLVYRTCRRELGSETLAEDAAQVVFLLLARKANTLRAGPSLAGWLYQTSVFVAKDVRKQEARRQRREEAVMQETLREPTSPASEWDAVEPLLNAALSSLKPADRDTVLLRFLEGHTLAETGALLGVTEDAARMRCARALERLRFYLTAHGSVVTGVALTALLTTEAARPVSAKAASAVTQGILQGLASGPAPNVLLLSKGVSHTMKIIKFKYAALATGTLLVLGVVPFVSHAVPMRSSDKIPSKGNGNISAKMSSDGRGVEILPLTVATSLSERELRLDHLTFAWQITDQKDFFAKRPGGGLSRPSTEVWHIARNSNETLVTGTKVQETYRGNFLQYYSGSSGVIVNTQNNYNGVSVAPLPPTIWGNSGDSIRYREPFQSGFDLMPEHFAILAGLNPLALYNAHWHMKAITALTWTLEASVPQGVTPESATTETIDLTLSRRLGNAPAKIVVKQGNEAWTFQALGYRRLGKDWICDRCSMSFKYPGIEKREQRWALQEIKPTVSPFSLPIPQDISAQVSDYRLVGLDLTTDEYLNALEQHSSKIAHYIWPGHLPTTRELATIKRS